MASILAMAKRSNVLGYEHLPKWTAIYKCMKHDAQEVIVNSVTRPERRRTFRIPRVGRVAFVAISITELNLPKEGKGMAKRRKKQQEEPEVDETEELEDLEDLEDLDDLEDEEPEDEAEDEEEGEDYDSMSVADLRSLAKERGLSASKARKAKKASLVKWLSEHEDDEEGDDEEEEEVEEKPKRKKRKGGAKKGQAPPTRELPKGRYGAQEIADLAGKDARAVRIWLRKHADEYPKDEDLGRYSFTKKQAESIAKKIKAGARKSD